MFGSKSINSKKERSAFHVVQMTEDPFTQGALLHMPEISESAIMGRSDLYKIISYIGFPHIFFFREVWLFPLYHCIWNFKQTQSLRQQSVGSIN